MLFQGGGINTEIIACFSTEGKLMAKLHYTRDYSINRQYIGFACHQITH